jgi:hypothetical protein
VAGIVRNIETISSRTLDEKLGENPPRTVRDPLPPNLLRNTPRHAGENTSRPRRVSKRFATEVLLEILGSRPPDYRPDNQSCCRYVTLSSGSLQPACLLGHWLDRVIGRDALLEVVKGERNERAFELLYYHEDPVRRLRTYATIGYGTREMLGDMQSYEDVGWTARQIEGVLIAESEADSRAGRLAAGSGGCS